LQQQVRIPRTGSRPEDVDFGSGPRDLNFQMGPDPEYVTGTRNMGTGEKKKHPLQSLFTANLINMAEIATVILLFRASHCCWTKAVHGPSLPGL